ncbi:MAG: non-hydrolyzing UDP-N-acetylglucosamine 2-epimerase [Sandaracinobacteroides sp.]
MAICGTRPEVVKLAPVIRALREREHRVLLVMTGQHPDLAPQMLRELGLCPDIELGVRGTGSTPPQLLAAIMARLPSVLEAWKPQLAIVQGDTVSTMAGALASAYARVPVAHVEAGLRTYDFAEPHPEELHRTLVTPMASLHFAPTRQAATALLREGVDQSRIHVTGNTGIDALHATLDRLNAEPGVSADFAERYPVIASATRPLVLVTVHRRENCGRRLQAIAAALSRLAGFCEAEIVLPLHPNPAVQSVLRERLEGLDCVHLMPPVDHVLMVWLMQRARVLLTDSGGLQEEAPGLGLRTLVLRKTTERPEALAAGASELVELKADSIVSAVRRTLSRRPLIPVHPFGDGKAAIRIAHIVEAFLGAETEDARMKAPAC